jgi:hypothetical protein
MLMLHGTWAAGIPEPSLVFYGTIRNTALENVRVNTGTLSWRFREPGSGWSKVFTTGITNLLDQFCYVLEVPCEQVVSSSLSTNALNLSGTAKQFDCSAVWCDGAPAMFADPSQTNLTLSARDRGRMIRLDLIIATPCEDIDVNGLCDSWELQYLGYIGVDPDDDPDKDGMSNRDEYRTGTNPLDHESVFQFLTMEYLGGSQVRVEWRSADGRRYALLRYPSLTSTNYVTVQTGILATTSNMSFVDTNAPSGGVAFYRVKLE